MVVVIVVVVVVVVVVIVVVVIVVVENPTLYSGDECYDHLMILVVLCMPPAPTAAAHAVAHTQVLLLQYSLTMEPTNFTPVYRKNNEDDEN